MWGIPDSCKIGKTVFKKNFYDNAGLSAKDKELFANVINKIQWQYCLKPETINVKAYKDYIRDYPEIEVVEVFVESDTKLRRIAEIVMRTIPYPMILIFTLNGKIQIWTAHQRINQNDPSKNIIEEFICTDWMDNSEFTMQSEQLFDIVKMDMSNLYTLYSSFVDAISIYKANVEFGIMDDKYSGEQLRELTMRMEEIDGLIAILRAKAKKETQFNRRVEIKLEIKRLENMKTKGGPIND